MWRANRTFGTFTTLRKVIKITFTKGYISQIMRLRLDKAFTKWYYEPMTVDELFDAIEEKITNDGYMPSKLWDAYIIIAKSHRDLIFNKEILC